MAATVHVTLGVVQHRAFTGSTLPIPPASPRLAETIASGAVSAVGVSAAQEGEAWTVTAKGGDVWVKFATVPVAAQGDGYLVLAGTTRDFGAVAGQKIAVKDA
jgi:hypothetical protein